MLRACNCFFGPDGTVQPPEALALVNRCCDSLIELNDLYGHDFPIKETTLVRVVVLAIAAVYHCLRNDDGNADTSEAPPRLPPAALWNETTQAAIAQVLGVGRCLVAVASHDGKHSRPGTSYAQLTPHRLL